MRSTLPPRSRLVRAPRASTIALAALVCLAAYPAADTVPLQIAEAGLAIDRPAAWRLGGVTGMGILFNYIGSNDGMPSFSVQTDPEAIVDDQTGAEAIDAQVEALFSAIALDRPGAEVVFSGWRTINGLRVHDSLSAFRSLAGTIMNRRIILVHRGRPWVLAWSDRRSDWDRIATLVEVCVESLREGAPPGVVAD